MGRRGSMWVAVSMLCGHSAPTAREQSGEHWMCDIGVEMGQAKTACTHQNFLARKIGRCARRWQPTGCACYARCYAKGCSTPGVVHVYPKVSSDQSRINPQSGPATVYVASRLTVSVQALRFRLGCLLPKN